MSDASRQKMIGIKQAIRIEWMDKTANLMLSGMSSNTIRESLHEFLDNKKADGSEGERSVQTRTFVVGNLMKIWVMPTQDLLPFRDTCLKAIQDYSNYRTPIHWAMISAVYPFWFNTALQTGRLFALQDQVTHGQIIKRVKEQYGDRQTVSRYAQFVIRSFVSWGLLLDTKSPGYYEKAQPNQIDAPDIAVLLLESALYTSSEFKGALASLQASPAFFPFQLPSISGDYITQCNNRIDVIRHGLDEELLKLKTI